jgi:release factor glutamine methyltransferase
MNVGTALLQGVKLLEDATVPAARLTAEVLLSHAIGCERPWLYAHWDDELKELWWIHYGRYLHERLEGKPTQYITKKQEFYGREFTVSRDVLIPRPETEHVVEAALERIKSGLVIDVGCGSGAIAITLQIETGSRVIATDVSIPAIAVARRNNDKLGAQVEFLACDILSAVRDRSAAMIVSNPPYVPSVDASVLQREVVAWEPHIALFGGPDGLDIYRRLMAEAERVLVPGGWLIMETAYNAGDAVTGMLGGHWRCVGMLRDLAGLPRVVMASLRE